MYLCFCHLILRPTICINFIRIIKELANKEYKNIQKPLASRGTLFFFTDPLVSAEPILGITGYIDILILIFVKTLSKRPIRSNLLFPRTNNTHKYIKLIDAYQMLSFTKLFYRLVCEMCQLENKVEIQRKAKFKVHVPLQYLQNPRG